MNKTLLLILTVALLVVIAPFSIAIASDIADAVFFGTVRATNTSAVAPNVSVNLSINSGDWIDNGTLNAAATSIAIRNSTGADTEFMPGYNGNPWIVQFDTVPDNGNIDYTLYTNATGGKIRYFPDMAGANVSDSADMELSDNFTISISGRVDTDNGTADKNLFSHIDTTDGGIECFISPTISGNITVRSYAIGASENSTDGTIIGVDELYGAAISRAGQRIDNFAGLITEVSFYLRNENGSPTGTGYARVRNAHDDTILGVMGSVDVSTIALIDWFTFTTDVEVLPAQDIRITFEYDGGDAGNDIGCGFNTSDTITGERTTYNSPNWTDTAAHDRNITIISEPYSDITSVSATGVSSGERNARAAQEPVLDFVSANDDYAQVASSSSLHFNTGGVDEPFSISTWVNMEDYSSATFIAKDDSGVQREWGFQTISSDYLLFRTYTDGSNRISQFSPEPMTSFENEWVHLVTTYDGSESETGMTLYLNGQALADNTSSLGSYTGMIDTTAKVTLGAFSNGLVQNIDGLMAETRVYSVELTPSEVASLFDTTAPKETDLAAYWQINDNIDTISDSSGNGIDLTNNGGDWINPGLLKIYIDNSLYNLEEGASVPDTSGNWTLAENGSMLYMETANITIGGTLQGSWEWEYAATFTDLSGNSHDATPTFRTTSSDADVSASLITFKPISEAKVTDNTSITWPVIMEDPPDEPSTAYSENITPGIFFAPFVHTIAEFGASNWSGATTNMLEQLFWYTFAFILIIGASILVYYFFADNAKEALFVKIFATAAVMIFFALPGINIYGLYVPLYYVLFATGILMLKKDFGW